MKILFYLTCLFLTFTETVCASQSTVFCSQASQDVFVYTLLYCVEKKSDQGYYLEIGAADPIITSNTCFLEKKLNWEGASIEINPQYQKDWVQKRRNRLLVEDATQADYLLILKSFPKIIDYLSLDVDGQYDIVLNKIPFDKYIFKIITIEHDFYRFGNIYKEKERKILASLGYQLLCPDVSFPRVGSFEDWWIHPAGFTEERFKELLSLDLEKKYHDEIISILMNRFNCKTD